MLDPLVVQLSVFTTAQLLALGRSRPQITEAVRRGRLSPLRRGWFAQDPSSRAAAVARAGGCVSCFQALGLRGVWVPRGTHARHPRHSSRHGCRPYGTAPGVHSIVDDLETAFRCSLRCGSIEDIVVVADSILHLGLATFEDLTAWAAQAPSRTQRLLHRVDRRSESGTETMVRLRLRALQIAVRTQVQIGRARVDLLVGDRLVIECDSRAHHTVAAAYQSDRARDRELVRRGYLVLRLTYEQVHDDWSTIEDAILDIVRERRHRWPRVRDARSR